MAPDDTPHSPDDTSQSPHAAVLEFDYDEESVARLVAAAVAQEVDEIADDRSRASVSRDGETVSVDVAAADLVALRAGLNTWGTLLEVAERTAAAGRRRR